MNKKIIIPIASAIVTIFITIIVLMTLMVSEKNYNSSTLWNEVEIIDGAYSTKMTMENFDLKKTITEADYVFSGKVLNRKEYKVEWTDDKGEQWGPFPSSIIEVRIEKEYNGVSPINGNIIKVYYPYSLSTNYSNSFKIEDDSEYVFVTRALDEEFVSNRNKQNPYDKFEQEKYADVYISSACYDLMAVNDGIISMYKDYFDWNNEYLVKIENVNQKNIDEHSSMELINSECFLEMKQEYFEEAFSDLFTYEATLPDKQELIDLHKGGIINETQK